MFEAIERVNRADREGKEAMHKELARRKAKSKKKPLTFLLDEKEMKRMRHRYTQDPLEKEKPNKCT